MSQLSDRPVPGLPPVLCNQCGTLLAPVLVTAGYATHPCCDPAEKPWEWRGGTSGRKVHPLPIVHRDAAPVKALSPRQRAAQKLARERAAAATRDAERPAPPREEPSLPGRKVTTVSPPRGLF